MALLACVVLAFTVLDGPGRWGLVAAGAAIEVVEAIVLVRLSRRRRALVGTQAMVGRRAVAVRECRPDGQVRIDGEIWAARCPAGCAAGRPVTITAVSGLTLVVVPENGQQGLTGP